jgi:hypothetical protein
LLLHYEQQRTVFRDRRTIHLLGCRPCLQRHRVQVTKTFNKIKSQQPSPGESVRDGTCFTVNRMVG